MASEFPWSKQAREDLLQIYLAIGRDNVAAAERVYDRLDELAAILKEQPWARGAKTFAPRPGCSSSAPTSFSMN